MFVFEERSLFFSKNASSIIAQTGSQVHRRSPRLSPDVTPLDFKTIELFANLNNSHKRPPAKQFNRSLRFAPLLIASLLIFFSSRCSDPRLLSRRCLHCKLVQQRRVFEKWKTLIYAIKRGRWIPEAQSYNLTPPAKYFQRSFIFAVLPIAIFNNFLSADDLPSFRCSNLWLLSRRLLHYNRTRFWT